MAAARTSNAAAPSDSVSARRIVNVLVGALLRDLGVSFFAAPLFRMILSLAVASLVLGLVGGTLRRVPPNLFALRVLSHLVFEVRHATQRSKIRTSSSIKGASRRTAKRLSLVASRRSVLPQRAMEPRLSAGVSQTPYGARMSA